MIEVTSNIYEDFDREWNLKVVITNFNNITSAQ